MTPDNQNAPKPTPCYETADSGEVPFLIQFYMSGMSLRAFPYGHLLSVDYTLASTDGDNLIRLHFSTAMVIIEGKRLARIVNHLGLQQLVLVRMVPEHHRIGGSKSEPIVTKITIESRTVKEA